MKFNKLILALAVIFTASFNLMSQERSSLPDLISERLEKYCRDFPREEIYISTDRENYVAGENIWMEVYLIDRRSLKPSDESSIAYVEILNYDNRPVLQKKIRLENGSGPGDMTLPDTLSPGTYTLRAYTNWMKNFLPGNCFSKTLNIYNAISTRPFMEKTREGSAEPEGTKTASKDLKYSGFRIRLKYISKDSLGIEIISDTYSRLRQGNTFFMLIQTRGNVNFKSPVNINYDTARFILRRSVLSPGVNDMVIFGSSMHPVAEKLIYTPQNEEPSINVSCRDKYSTRDKISLDLTLPSGQIKASEGSEMSISVAPVMGNVFPDISEYLVFGSEYGVLPDNFFSSISSSGPDKADEMLSSLRSNWIDWDLISAGTGPSIKYARETKDHYIYGKLKNKDSQAPDSGRYVFLSIPGNNALFQYAVTDRDGDFHFKVPIDDLVRDIIIQPEDIGRNDVIEMKTSFSDVYPDRKYKLVSSGEKTPEIISRMEINYQVGKIYGISDTSKAVPPRLFVNKSKRFYGKPDVELIMDDYIKLPVMQEVFFELMPGVFLKEKKSKYEITVTDPVDNRVYDKPPTLFVDGVVVNDPAVIANLDPELVREIDAVRDKYFVGDYMFYGLVSVITRAGNFSNVTLPDYAVRLSYRVIDPARSFTAPSYSNTAALQSRIPDFRNTLYWNPGLKPDREGKFPAEFWTSDFASDYRINVNGLTNDCRFFSASKIITVK